MTPPAPARPRSLIIFDCDGVLTDSERLAVAVDVAILAELGLPMDADEVIGRFMGRSDAETQSDIEALLGRPLGPDWQAEVDARYRAAFTEALEPVPGVVAALERIDAECAGLANCVASSGTHAHLRFTLTLTGLWDRFVGRIFSAEDVTAGKPAPDVFLHAAAAMGAAPEDCVVVEDSLNGVRAARAAGMPVLAFTGGLTPADQLAGPDTTLFADMAELPDLIQRWCPV